MMSLSSRFSPYISDYDFLKLFAIVTMVIDHVGFYFFPEENWFRVVGRTSFPVWLFLIGYARTRDISLPLVFWGGSIVLVNIIFGLFIIPFNILVTVIVVRLCLERIVQFSFSNFDVLYSFFAFCIVFLFPTLLIFDYGTLAFLMALAGYVIRNQPDILSGKYAKIVFFSLVIFAYAAVESALFGFIGWQIAVCFSLIGMVGYFLFHFQPREYPVLTDRLPVFLRWGIQFCGRYTLEIYAIHLIVFSIAQVLLKNGWDGIDWFDPSFIFGG